ncbi:MAG TPA: energy transducer TonB [Blastocatellia bacterium]|nr:energy transducer TonB [Blastocatellia bacterium]
MKTSRCFVSLIACTMIAATASPQSGVHRARTGPYDYGVDLTFAVLQYDASHSPEVKDVTKLGESFSSPKEEAAFLKVKMKIEDVSLRHDRSVGLVPGQSFDDAVLLGPEYMVIKVTPAQIQHEKMMFNLEVRYANQPLLDLKSVELENFETVLLKGGKGMFGAKYFIGAGGRQESAPIERTLLVSVKAQIVPVAELHDRPEDISHPVDENGLAIPLKASDRYTPPVTLERVVPKFETGRQIQGSVVLGAIVTVDGKITNVRVITSIDSEIDQKAVEAFRQYKFSAALLNGKPVASAYRQRITFTREPTAWEIEEQKELDKKSGQKPAPKRKRPWPF